MDINKVLEQLDSISGEDGGRKTEEFLKDKIKEAGDEGDLSSELTLVNELIGFLRYMGKFTDAQAVIGDARRLCEDMGITGTVSHATTLLNIATLERAMGRHEESLKDYEQVQDIYDRVLAPDDYLYAALYNNMSLLYQETGDHEKSALCLKKAIPIISNYDDKRIEQAISRTNLAQTCLMLGRLDEAEAELISAEDIFEKDGGNEFHYPGCLNAIADLKMRKGDLKGAVNYYTKALGLLELKVGRDNPGYIAVSENLAEAEKMLKVSGGIDKEISGMELARRFYKEYGQAMIHEGFAEYEDRITAGLVGRGSQCYGFDDPLSRDHDFGPDFCIWLDDDLYDEIGDKLQEAYDRLPAEFMGFSRVTVIPPDGKRAGVMRTWEFYARILDVSEEFLLSYIDIFCKRRHLCEEDKKPEPGITAGVEAGRVEEECNRMELAFFGTVDEANLSQCTNGEIFKEGTGDFARIREGLKYYPDHIWKRKIAQELHYSAQMGQYNYVRMLKRGEKVASEIALSGYMEHTMKLVYLLNRKYAPYYKWLHRGMADLEKAAVIMDIFNAVYDMPKGDERIRMTTEIVAAIIIEELEKLNMTGGVPKEEKFLDVYSRII
ncbi:MAG TPA: hypothetical protein DIS78_10745 [Lachnospiraceae bacterium]|nr:hypothetical protein [Lachnospiraceae bacterium]